MAITGPRGLLLPGPRHQVLPYGLFTAIDWVETDDPHWMAGVEFEDFFCVEGTSVIPVECNAATGVLAKSTGGAGSAAFRMHDPFAVLANFKCAVGGLVGDDVFGYARRRLELTAEQTAENVFWTGDVLGATVISPNLEDGYGVTPTTVTTGPVDILDGLEALIQALEDCNPGQGVLHLPAKLHTAMHDRHAVVHDGDATFTHGGHRIVFGSGYPGTGPAGVVPAVGADFIFITGPLFGVRGEVFFTPERLEDAVDKSLNDISIWAEQVYAIGYSCCAFAAEVTT